MMHFLVLLGLLLLTVPAEASYVFDGTGDDISSGNGAVTNIDVANFSWSACIKVTSQPSAAGTIAIIGETFDVGLYTRVLYVDAPGTSGFRFGFLQNFGSGGGDWKYQTDLNLNQWYQVGVDYDSNAANDPVFIVNGSSVSPTELSTPSGSRSFGDDTLRLGAWLDGSTTYVGKIEEVAFWSARLSGGNWSTVSASGPSSLTSNRVFYIPLQTNAVDQDGNTGALTVTGATLDTADHCLSSTTRRRTF